jgi:hypothetical protein
MDHVVRTATPATQGIIRAQFLWGRSLDRGGPQAGAIGSDFGRFGVPFWQDVNGLHAANERRRELLDELMRWRNAIAHNDFHPAVFGPSPILHLADVRGWRSALNGLCPAFDTVMRDYMATTLEAAPWPP